MRRILIPGILFYILLLTGLFLRQGNMVALALPMAVYFFLGMFFGPKEIRLKITRKLNVERIPLGMPVKVTISIFNLGEGLEQVCLEDQVPVPLKITSGNPKRLVRIKRGGSLTWEYEVVGPRGCYRFPEIAVDASDLMSVYHKQELVTTDGQLYVLPPVFHLRRVYIRPRRTLVYSGNIPARQGGPGVEFFGVREYQPGDSPHWINWHASARHPDTLYCNEFEQEHITDVGIILDGRRITNIIKDRSIFENSVIAAATLAETFISSGNRVGLLVYGNYLQWTYPGYGKQQWERILQTLSQADVGDSLVFTDLAFLPTRLFPAESQLLIISPLREEDLEVLIMLRSRGYQVIIVSPDPIMFEFQNLPHDPTVEIAMRVLRMERDILLTRLFRAGVQVVDWDVSKPLEQVIRAALGRPLAWMQTIRR